MSEQPPAAAAGLPGRPRPAPLAAPAPLPAAPGGYQPSPAPAPAYQPAPVAYQQPAPAAAPAVAPAVAPSVAPSAAPQPQVRYEAPVDPGHEDSPVTESLAGDSVTSVETEDGSSRLNIDELLVHLLEVGGSDLHLSSGAPPKVRVRGDMQNVPNYEILTPQVLEATLYAIVTGRQRERFDETLELDFAYTVPGRARFRVNLMHQRGTIGAVMRVIPWEIKSLEQLGVPPIVATFADLPRGLVLVTGPTGSGKSTTLAALVDRANKTRAGHIVTVEDPIEFLHQHRQCVVNQREVGADTHSFAAALKHVLRQDPDIILVGELRDLETMAVALSAAETGHLVFATLHTQSAGETVTRLVDGFPAGQQDQIRTQIAGTIQGIVCQQLCKTADGAGRVAALEILVATPALRANIRDDKLHQIPSALQAGAKHGMQTMNQALAQLVITGRITYEVAAEKCSDLVDLDTLVGPRKNGPSTVSPY